MNLIKNDKKLYYDIGSYLILSLPITIIFSRFLADFSIVLLSLLFFLIRGNNKLFENKVVLLSFIFIFFAVISSLLSLNILLSLKSSMLHIRFVFFSLAVSLIFIYFKEDFIKKLFYLFVICYLILFFDSTYQFFFKQNIFGYVVDPPDRISSLFFGELVLGTYLAKLFPILVFLYLFLKIKINKLLIIYFLLHLYFTSFITGERTSFFILNIYYFLFSLLIFRNSFKKFYLTIIVVIFFISSVLGSNLINARSSFSTIEGSFTSYNFTVCNNTKDNIEYKKLGKYWSNYTPNCDPIFEIFDRKVYYFPSVMHFNHYIAAVSIFKDYKLLGIGPKNYRFKCFEDKYYLNEYSCSTHPHNYFLQLLAETGIVGFTVFTIIYFIFIYLFFKNLFSYDEKNSLCKLILISCFLVNFLPLLPSGNFFNNWVSILYSFPLGFLLGMYSYKTE